MFDRITHIERGFERVEHSQRVFGVGLPDRVRGGKLAPGGVHVRLDILADLACGLAEEFVVVQCRLAHSKGFDPCWFKSDPEAK